MPSESRKRPARKYKEALGPKPPRPISIATSPPEDWEKFLNWERDFTDRLRSVCEREGVAIGENDAPDWEALATKLLYLHEPDFRPSPGPKPKSVAARRKLLAFFEASEFKRVDTFAKWLVAPADGKKKQRLPAEFKGKGFDTVRDAIRRAKRERKEERDEAARQMYGAGAIIAMQRRLGKN